MLRAVQGIRKRAVSNNIRCLCLDRVALLTMRSVYNWADDLAASQSTARTLAEHAANLSGDDPLILAVRGTVHTFVRNYGTARVLLERALALNPNCV